MVMHRHAHHHMAMDFSVTSALWRAAQRTARVPVIPRKMIVDPYVYRDGVRLVHKKKNPKYAPALSKVRKAYRKKVSAYKKTGRI